MIETICTIKLSVFLARHPLRGNIVNHQKHADTGMNTKVSESDLKKGVMHIKSKGFKVLFLSLVPFDDLDRSNIPHTPLNDTNPICRRLFDIFAMDGVISNFKSDNEGSILFSAIKTCEINDAFFNAGYYKISK